MSKVISRLFWFCITTLCDWLTKLAPLSQPMGIQTKTSCVSAARVSRAWRPLHVFATNSDWLVVLFSSVAIGQSNYFGFGFTTLSWKPFYHSTSCYYCSYIPYKYCNETCFYPNVIHLFDNEYLITYLVIELSIIRIVSDLLF